MQAFAIGRVIAKTRHHVRHGGRLYEVDVFGGELGGLVMPSSRTPTPGANGSCRLGSAARSRGARSLNAALALADAVARPCAPLRRGGS